MLSPINMFYRLIIITMPKSKPFIKWEKFWRLTAMWEHYSNDWGKVTFEKMQCDCWTIKRIGRAIIRQWRTKSCWCLNREIWAMKLRKYNTRHWLANSRLYRIYSLAKSRCNNPKNPCYDRYWGRWIKFLRATFEDFCKDMEESYDTHIKEYWEKNTTIDRIDVNGNYCRENCKRATWREQSYNREYNINVTYKWETLPLQEISKKYWIPYNTLKYRLKSWLSPEDAINKIKYQKIKKHNQEMLNKKKSDLDSNLD